MFVDTGQTSCQLAKIFMDSVVVEDLRTVGHHDMVIFLFTTVMKDQRMALSSNRVSEIKCTPPSLCVFTVH